MPRRLKIIRNNDPDPKTLIVNRAEADDRLRKT
jgi:hypothetical protein